ncbi:hypothetical protein MNR01_05170 [Lysobacter sp. S4-A87]|uniref:hypothetical protein n=1 Tax=Lysobacter sp. S4-A87 TaxID=2925843 RepID=UPI001F5366CE|nr:hypothetical protein [Lysobacter sp. S4-A87]UNK50412.1 hypothetical protein MNR01_05170 [Lysobacter sp. S4-A87]
MNAPHRSWKSATAWLDRRFGFHGAAHAARAAVAVALLFGLMSVWRGQDSNWDLRNYHLYNAYAWLTDRLATDLAPAQLQSYFVPWLDLPYFLAAQHWPRLTAMVLGTWHGLAFALAAGIGWLALAGRPGRHRLVPMLALAGCFSAVFLSELGTTMGDNTSAIFVLAALLLVLQAASVDGVPAGRMSWRWWLAGVVLGLGVSFKLTNAIYALALGVAVLSGPWSWTRRIKCAASLTVATTATIAVVAGPWLWGMWRQFGNPLFPQFNGWFQAPLAIPVSVADQRWLPSGVVEAALRPLKFTINPFLISEIPLLQIIWAVLYLLAIAAVASWLWRRSAGVVRQDVAVTTAARLLLVFFAVAFVAWLAVFSIHRYLAVLEVLAPLVLWLLAERVFAPALAARVATCAIVATIAVTLAGTWLTGWGNWGHAGWTDRPFRVDAPAMAQPAQSTVLLVGTEPQAWRIPFLPAAAAYASVGSNLPESEHYADTIRARIAARPGGVYAMLPADVDNRMVKRLARMAQINAWAGRLHLDRGDCGLLRKIARNRRADVQVGDGRCRLAPRAEESGRDVAVENRALADAAVQTLARYGLRMSPDGCRVHAASIGTEALPFQWCPVERPAP